MMTGDSGVGSAGDAVEAGDSRVSRDLDGLDTVDFVNEHRIHLPGEYKWKNEHALSN